MLAQAFLIPVPSQKYQLEPLSSHKYTFTRSKDFRWGIIALRWSTEIREDELRRVKKIDSNHLHLSFPQVRQPRSERKPSSRRGKWSGYSFHSRPQHSPTQHQANSCDPKRFLVFSIKPRPPAHPSTGQHSWPRQFLWPQASNELLQTQTPGGYPQTQPSRWTQSQVHH